MRRPSCARRTAVVRPVGPCVRRAPAVHGMGPVDAISTRRHRRPSRSPALAALAVARRRAQAPRAQPRPPTAPAARQRAPRAGARGADRHRDARRRRRARRADDARPRAPRARLRRAGRAARAPPGAVGHGVLGERLAAQLLVLPAARHRPVARQHDARRRAAERAGGPAGLLLRLPRPRELRRERADPARRRHEHATGRRRSAAR